MKPQDVMLQRTQSHPPENPKIKSGACVPGRSGGGFKPSSQWVDVGGCDNREPGRDRGRQLPLPSPNRSACTLGRKS